MKKMTEKNVETTTKEKKTGAKKNEDIDCCANCRYCADRPKNNRYGDIEHFCMATGYLMVGVNKDIHKVRHFTPGGRELVCKYERKSE